MFFAWGQSEDNCYFKVLSGHYSLEEKQKCYTVADLGVVVIDNMFFVLKERKNLDI